MALSEREQKVLEQLEQQLSFEDPHFASQMSDVSRGSSFSTRNVVVGVLIAAVGIGVLLWGVTVQLIWLGVIGFLMMGGGVFFATMRSKKTRFTESARESANQSSFLAGLEDKWEERRRQQP